MRLVSEGRKRMLNDYIDENSDLWGLKYMLKKHNKK